MEAARATFLADAPGSEVSLFFAPVTEKVPAALSARVSPAAPVSELALATRVSPPDLEEAACASSSSSGASSEPDRRAPLQGGRADLSVLSIPGLGLCQTFSTLGGVSGAGSCSRDTASTTYPKAYAPCRTCEPKLWLACGSCSSAMEADRRRRSSPGCLENQTTWLLLLLGPRPQPLGAPQP